MPEAPVVRFVIFAAPRTGSNVLCSLLNSHPDILCHHGLFNPAGIHYALDHREGDLDLGTTAERDSQPKDFITKMWRHCFGKNAVGFKFNRGENELAGQTVLDDPDVRKILLTRRNRVKTYVSELIAQQTGQWESYWHMRVKPVPAKVYVNPGALFRHIALNENFYQEIEQKLRTSDQGFLRIHYELLFCGHEENGGISDLERVLSYLDQRMVTSGMTPASAKQNPDDLRETIANFAELATALHGSGVEDELHCLDASRFQSATIPAS